MPLFNPKFASRILVNINRSEFILLLFIVFIYFSYVLSRSLVSVENTTLFLVGWWFTFLFYKAYLRALVKRLLKLIVLFLSIYVLIYSLLYPRYSWDGFLLYTKNVFNVKNMGVSFSLESAHFPYLSELMIGLLSKIVGVQNALVLFGVAALSSCITTLILYSKLVVSRWVRHMAFLIFVSSPTFLMLTFYEFKVELFLLVFVNIALLIWLRMFDRFTNWKVFWFGLFSSLAFLTKILAPLFLFPLIVFTVLFFVKRGILGKLEALKKLILFFAAFICPVFLWILYAPTYLPFIGSIDLHNMINPLGFEGLEVNENIRQTCMNEQRYKDLSSFIFYTNITSLLKQPLQYLFLQNITDYQFAFHFANPSLFVFFGVWLCGLAFYLSFKNSDFKLGLIFLSSMVFVASVFIVSKTIYWYYFAIFPILSLVVPYIVDVVVKSDYIRNFFNLLVVSLFFSQIFWGFTYSVFLLDNVDNYALGVKSIVNMNKTLESLSKESFVMDATQHHYVAFYVFMDNAHERLVRSTYYFVSSSKNLEQMRQELINKNITYIVAIPDYLFDGWYTGCQFRNNEILFRFLNDHTKLMHDFGTYGKIYKVI